jgi:hypothetical protein
MGNFKFVGIIAITATLTFYITFTVTKNHYIAPNLSVNTCEDDVIPLAVFPPASAPLSPDQSVVVENKTASTNEISPAVQVIHQTADIEALVKARDAQQQQINILRQFASEKNSQSLIEESNLRYEAELVDYQWAATEENKLLSIFADTTALDSYIPTHMSCRSVTCKITIPSQDDASADKAYRALWQVLASNNPDSNYSITYFPNPEKGEFVVYISSQGNSIFQ